MVWLFDMGKSYRHLFEPSIISKLEEAHAMNEKKRTKWNKPSKKREYLHSVCQDLQRKIRPSDPSSRPINLEILDFTTFTRYLYTFKKKVKKRTSEGNALVGDGKNKTIRISPSPFDGACSALSHLFTKSGNTKEKTDITKKLWTKLSSFKKGTRRVSAKEKKAWIVNDWREKPLTFCAYQYLAKILFESDKPEYVSAHTFLVLEWNLISHTKYLVEAPIDAVTSK